ncbi:SAM-dependent methyltransferase [Geminicoccus roseus]|uniref:SAM-dependent methyltransferase n=1 Tax=Geminicoccus roseus TaxID=404900 RepID=UPI000488ED73|nr:cyclopropane-fatty-acyl-phospholipid synthase family protein [Geminicoccus roseus]
MGVSEAGATSIFAVLLGMARQLRVGQLTIVLPDGSRHDYRGTESGPSGVLVLNRPRVVRRFLTGGANGFADSYLDGDWDSPDLARLLQVLAMNEQSFADHYYGKPWVRAIARIAHLLRPNTRRGSKKNIHAHYDLGNQFYQRWLDPSMTYSSAVYERPDATLEEAQLAKLRRLATMTGVRPDAHVLEIGCGWGSFAELAAKEFGAKVTGLTISDAQAEFARKRIFEAGLAERVKIEIRDYRDVEGRFDAVTSIEMFEAVGERFWPGYFAKLRDVLVEGGRAALQIITIDERNWENYRTSADFIQRYVFPGGMLPTKSALDRLATSSGLRRTAMSGHGIAYADTLAEWNRRFQKAWPDLVPMGFDTRFKRIWEFYLAYCEAGFRTDNIDVVQVAYAR